ncbi:radical SAM protein [Desulfobacter sp.]|uniref:radical SAM protein n=1 Tax=Desulfobacter sp. TaxID=2294 RepID=UPI003D11518F
MAPCRTAGLSPEGAQTLAVTYNCENRCTICFVEGLRNKVPPMDMETFKKHVDDQRCRPKFNRLVLSGGEVALDTDFIRRVEYAAASRSYQKIRIQTNACGFADPAFTREIINAGVDEFYVSLHAASQTLDRKITRNGKNFSAKIKGIENILACGGTLITCTVVFSTNLCQLEKTAEFIAEFAPARAEFYNLVAVAPAHNALMARLSLIKPRLLSSMNILTSQGINTASTFIPKCLLEHHRDRHTHHLPQTVIDPGFWKCYPGFACFYEKTCRWHGQCEGLSFPYLSQFGWETRILKPEPVMPEEKRRPGPEKSFTATDEEWLTLFKGPDGGLLTETSLWRLEGIRRQKRRVRFQMVCPGGSRHILMLEPRDDTRKRHGQTTGFNVTLLELPPPKTESGFKRRLRLTLMALLRRNDDGRMALE